MIKVKHGTHIVTSEQYSSTVLHIVWVHVLNVVFAPLWPYWDHHLLTDTEHIHEYDTAPDTWVVKTVIFRCVHCYDHISSHIYIHERLKGKSYVSYNVDLIQFCGTNCSKQTTFTMDITPFLEKKKHKGNFAWFSPYGTTGSQTDYENRS